jgi:hypothetical protein
MPVSKLNSAQIANLLLLDNNSTALLVSKGLSLSGYSTGVVTHDSTGNLIANGKVKIADKAGGLLNANATSLLLPGTLKLSGKSTGYMSHDSTGTLKLSGALKLSGKSTGSMTHNSTGSLVLSGGIKLSGKSTGLLTATSTGHFVANVGFKIGTNTFIYENSTGCLLKWKSTATYITRNTTAN